MKVISTPFQGLFVIEPGIFQDDRGYFFESYNKRLFDEKVHSCDFVQDNESLSGRSVIRGLHYQVKPHAQAKLVRVISGVILDIAVDLRKGSPGFGKWFGLELSSGNRKQLFIPEGFAHGFSVLSEQATVVYKCTDFHHPELEYGINCFDPRLAIDWKFSQGEAILSAKDRILPCFDDAFMNFVFTDN